MAEINKDWRTFTSQRQWQAYFKSELPKNDILLKRSIAIIYALQTNSEQRKNSVVEHNGCGFNRVDGNIMSKIAKKLEIGISLSDIDLKEARNRMGKYWKQLMLHVKSKQEQEKIKNSPTNCSKHLVEEIHNQEMWMKYSYNPDFITEYKEIC